MYTLKQTPQDFIVDEVLDIKHYLQPKGGYSYYLLRKQDQNTIDAIGRIASHLKIYPKYINFCGTKDKIAVTSQFISIRGGPDKDLSLSNMTLEFLGFGQTRLALGMHKGNDFRITARQISHQPKKLQKMVNYFDSQRFGRDGKNTLIGKALIKKDFAQALELMGDQAASNHLRERPKDIIGAIKLVPKKLLLLYIHAYQSHLWNICVKETLKKSSIPREIPIIGFGTEPEDQTAEILDIMQKEAITTNDFLIRQMPELTSEGSSREIFCEITGLEISDIMDDELSPGSKKVILSFFLPKGCYATQAVKQMFDEAQAKL